MSSVQSGVKSHCSPTKLVHAGPSIRFVLQAYSPKARSSMSSEQPGEIASFVHSPGQPVSIRLKSLPTSYLPPPPFPPGLFVFLKRLRHLSFLVASSNLTHDPFHLAGLPSISGFSSSICDRFCHHPDLALPPLGCLHVFLPGSTLPSLPPASCYSPTKVDAHSNHICLRPGSRLQRPSAIWHSSFPLSLHLSTKVPEISSPSHSQQHGSKPHHHRLHGGKPHAGPLFPRYLGH